MSLNKFCIYCSNEFDNSAKFCNQCGAARGAVTKSQEDETTNDQVSVQNTIDYPEANDISKTEQGKYGWALVSSIVILAIFALTFLASTSSPPSGQQGSVDIRQVATSDFYVMNANWAVKTYVTDELCLNAGGSCIKTDFLTTEPCSIGIAEYEVSKSQGEVKSEFVSFSMFKKQTDPETYDATYNFQWNEVWDSFQILDVRCSVYE